MSCFKKAGRVKVSFSQNNANRFSINFNARKSVKGVMPKLDENAQSILDAQDVEKEMDRLLNLLSDNYRNPILVARISEELRLLLNPPTKLIKNNKNY